MNRTRTLARIGSLRLALGLLALLAVVVLVRPTLWALAAVFALLALNLLAAFAVHPALRRQFALGVLHLALLVVLGLVALGRLTALDGRFELTEGVPFDGTLIDKVAGPMHVDRLRALAFRHEGFEIDYAPGRKRGATRNRVVWQDTAGVRHERQIGDHRPLVLDGHRFYTSSNKGFAPLLRWTPDAGAPILGAVHLPSFPVHELRQSREWTLPDGRAVWVMLAFDESLIDPSGPTRFRLPDDYRLVVRTGEQRAELAVGESMALAGGQLRFDSLRTWMGYRVAYDPTLPWLLAAALLAALSLGWHYTLKFRAAPATASAMLRRAADA